MAEFADEGVHICPPPVGFGEIAACSSVGRVGFVVGEVGQAPLLRRIGVEIIIEVDAGDVVAGYEVAHDGVDVAADFGRSGIHVEDGADPVGVLRKPAADVARCARVGDIGCGAVGIDPRMNFQTALAGFADKKGERVVARRLPLFSREKTAPGL